MQFMDSHIHLQDIKLIHATDFIFQARQLGIKKFICVSAQEEDWLWALGWAKCFPDKVIPAIGLHPWYAAQCPKNWEECLEGLLQAHPKALVGECGLDGAKGRDVSGQLPFFEKQIMLAEKYHRPLLIHSVHAVRETLSALNSVKTPFVWHSFAGSAETAAQIIKQGGYLGVNLGFLKSKHWKNVLKSIDVCNILLESDAPYQYSSESILELCTGLNNFYGKDISEIFYQNSLRFINGGK